MNISVAGDVILDVEMQVQPQENYEDAAICLTGKQYTYYPGGAANVAVLLRGLGHDVSLFGLVGSDWAAEELYNLLDGIDIHCLSLLTTTTTKIRVFDGDLLMRIDCENPKACDWAMEKCLSEFRLHRPSCVVFSDYSKGVFDHHVRDAVQQIIQHEPAIPTVVDPKPCDYSDIWAGCTVALPNDREMDEMTLDTQNLVVTHGSRGAVLTNVSGAAVIPCCEANNPQIVGAGDAFTAGMAASLSQDDDIMKAAEFAVEFAADYVSRPR